MTSFTALSERWRTEAELLDRYGASQLAGACRRHADELDGAVRDDEHEPLTLEDAEGESGYSRDRLRHMVADGVIANAGRKGAPRIRRGDLPRKRRQSGDDRSDVNALATHLLRAAK